MSRRVVLSQPMRGMSTAQAALCGAACAVPLVLLGLLAAACGADSPSRDESPDPVRSATSNAGGSSGAENAAGFETLVRDYFVLLRAGREIEAIRLFHPDARRSGRTVVIRDSARVHDASAAGVVRKLWVIRLSQAGLTPPGVPIRVYQSDVERLRELGRLFPDAAIVGVRLGDGEVRKIFAVRSGQGAKASAYLLP